MANALPGDLRCLDQQPVSLQDQPAPSHPGTTHLEAEMQSCEPGNPNREPHGPCHGYHGLRRQGQILLHPAHLPLRRLVQILSQFERDVSDERHAGGVTYITIRAYRVI